jgi:hypothetical protein
MAWMAALALLGASVSPCPSPEPAERPSHADCHRPATDRFLDAPCPCGCADGAPATDLARIGEALLASPVAVEPAPRGDAPAPAAAIGPTAPHRSIDHVPRIA